MTEVKLSRIVTVLEELDYPLGRDEALERCEGITILLADGQVSLSAVIDDTGATNYGSMEELLAEVMGALPKRAVGEPGQSEGDA